MVSRSLTQVLMARRLITLTGLVLSLMLAGGTYFITPKTYVSSGTAVLMKQSGPNSINPLLSFPSDDSLSITALFLVQFMNGPNIPSDLGLVEGQDMFTVKNGGSSAVKIDGIQQPFYSVTAQSADPAKSANIVTDVLAKSRQELEALQTAFKVPPGEDVLLVSVVDATPPTLAWDIQVRAIAVPLLLGTIITITTACVYERIIQRRAHQIGKTTIEAPPPKSASGAVRQSPNRATGVSAMSSEKPQ
jgi:hypothetical protein